MWFKNAQIFCLAERFPFNAENLTHRLSQRPAAPCPKSQPFCHGWIAPFEEETAVSPSEELVYENHHCLLIANCKEERLLPAGVVREAVAQKIAEIEEKEQREVFAKERSRLRDEMTFSLLPQAFTQKTITHAYFDLSQGWLIIDAASRTKAETFTELLRNTLGSLKLEPFNVENTLSQQMGQWLLQHRAPEAFEIGQECEMRDREQARGKIRFSQLKLTDPDVINHLKQNHRVTQLELVWKERISFILHEDLSITRLRFLDIIKDSVKDLETTDDKTLQMTSFAMMALELRQALSQLMQALNIPLSAATMATPHPDAQSHAYLDTAPEALVAAHSHS